MPIETAGKPQAQPPTRQDIRAPDPPLYLGVAELRRRRWTRRQINSLPADLEIKTDPTILCG